MASSSSSFTSEDGAITATYQRSQELLSTLPREKGWTWGCLVQYQGFWLPELAFPGILLAQRHFTSSPSDVLISSVPKSGTTWLKALIFTIFNRGKITLNYNPLLSANPHDLIPNMDLFVKDNPTALKQGLPFFSTHIPFSSLPDSILASGCRIVYIHRDPKDVFVSLWHFASKLRPKDLPPLSMEEAFEMFARGAGPNGPLWDHVLGYWKASLEWPERVLFLKYEEMKRDTAVHVKRLAEFVSRPFSPEEESGGEVERVISLCGFEKLKNLEVNKTGKLSHRCEVEFVKEAYFRKGEVGDWENHLTPEMAERLNRITEMKFKGTPLFSVLS